MGALEELKPQQLKSIVCSRNSATKNNGTRRLREEVQKEAEELHRLAMAKIKWIFLHDIDTLTQSQKKLKRKRPELHPEVPESNWYQQDPVLPADK